MTKYRSLYLWMIVPMIVMQLGIAVDYWGDLTENAWSVHVHYWTGTAWYLFLILQPYYATHGQLARHRTLGIIGMFLGGGVCLTALSMMHRDIATADRALASPEQFGPFQPWFFFGVAAVEIVMMTAFAYAVIKSIIHRKDIDSHAWWLVSSVFLIMMPALGRGLQGLYFTVSPSAIPSGDIMSPLYVSQAMILAMIVAAGWKYGTLRHPATYLAVAVNVFVMLLEPLGRSDGIQWAIRSVIKG